MNSIKTVGVITGKFAPLHNGHIYAITQAATQVDTLYVVLSYDDKLFDGLDNEEYLRQRMSKNKRLLWLKRTFQDMDHIKILCVDESNIKPYPEGMYEWANAVRNELFLANFGGKIDKWFSSEPEYGTWVKEHFGAKHVVIDSSRHHFNICATDIRKNLFKYWEHLPSIVRREFLLKVVLIGTESCAKSTLTKYLAKMFNTSWVDEYGRTYCEVDMCMDESLLTFNDYGIIAAERYQQEREAERTANRVLFLDTDAFVTQYYCKMYEGKKHPLVDAFIEQESYDIVLHMSDEVEWVADGLRINADRTRTQKLFDNMLDEYGIKAQNGYHYIEGNYQQRLDRAVAIIEKHLG